MFMARVEVTHKNLWFTTGSRQQTHQEQGDPRESCPEMQMKSKYDAVFPGHSMLFPLRLPGLSEQEFIFAIILSNQLFAPANQLASAALRGGTTGTVDKCLTACLRLRH